MSATPDVKIMRGGAVGSRKYSRTAMKFMARNQLRNCVQRPRRWVKIHTIVPMITGRCRAPYDQTRKSISGGNALTRPWTHGSHQMPMAFSRFMKKRPLARATASRPSTTARETS